MISVPDMMASSSGPLVPMVVTDGRQKDKLLLLRIEGVLMYMRYIGGNFFLKYTLWNIFSKFLVDQLHLLSPHTRTEEKPKI